MTKIYLISPPQIDLAIFSKELIKIFKTNRIPIFQLRLKNTSVNDIKNKAKEIKKICDDYNVSLIINDYAEIATQIDAYGVHLGIDDIKNFQQIKFLKKNNPKLIIGVSCYDSKVLAIQAKEQGADQISFGAFFASQTKISRGSPSLDLIDWAKINLNLPIIGIGGINQENYQILINHKIDYIALISFIWNYPAGSVEAIKSLKINE
ncbi:thiamine-phosphate synthase [Alphaproteobacteria bacterium]|nr:thiamine-phosphate synthase [Alphaproteobacteria bacterium]